VRCFYPHDAADEQTDGDGERGADKAGNEKRMVDQVQFEPSLPTDVSGRFMRNCLA
jgi:hypothetical protein